MQWTNDGTRYGLVSQALHWATAVLIFATIPIGLYGKAQPLDSAAREWALEIHKPLGLTVIGLVALRLLWLRVSPVSVDVGTLQRWEVVAARIGHALLYAIILLMPLSGLLMSQGAGRETSYFGLFDVPQMLPIDPDLPRRSQPFYLWGKFLHDEVFQWALYAIFALHMAGVIKHRFVDGDRIFLRRMWGAGSAAERATPPA